MSLAAIAAGADAVMIEVHDSPELAKSDGEQALIPEIFGSSCRICAQLPPPSAARFAAPRFPFDRRAELSGEREPSRWRKRATRWICFPSLRARIDRGKIAETPPIAFSHVIESAQPFLVAALAREIRRTFWIICPTRALAGKAL